MKKRIKADNVEQLMEIVQAVQRGEDTETIAARRAEQKKQEAREAALREQAERERRRERRKHLIGKFLGRAEDWEDEEPEEAQSEPEESAARKDLERGSQKETEQNNFGNSRGRAEDSAARSGYGRGDQPESVRNGSGGSRGRAERIITRSGSGRGDQPESAQNSSRYGGRTEENETGSAGNYKVWPTLQGEFTDAAGQENSEEPGRLRNRRTASAYERWIEEDWLKDDSDGVEAEYGSGSRLEEDKSARTAQNVQSEENWQESVEEAAGEPDEESGPTVAERVKEGLGRLGGFLKRALSDEEGRLPAPGVAEIEEEEPAAARTEGKKAEDRLKMREAGSPSAKQKEDSRPATQETVSLAAMREAGSRSELQETDSKTETQKEGGQEVLGGHFHWPGKRKSGAASSGHVRRRFGTGASDEAEAVGRRILKSLNMESASEPEGEKEEPVDPETGRTLDRIISRMEEEGQQAASGSGASRSGESGAVPESGSARQEAGGKAQDPDSGLTGKGLAASVGKTETTESSGTVSDAGNRASGKDASGSHSGEAGEGSDKDASGSRSGEAGEGSDKDASGSRSGEAGEGSDKDASGSRSGEAGENPDGKHSARPRLSDFKEPEGGFDPRGAIDSVADRFRLWLKNLNEKGIGRREFAMLGTCAVLAVLVIILIGNAIAGTVSTRRKQKYVTADDGLTVTVEQQPDTWCTKAEVKLKFTSKAGVIQTLRLNGETEQPDEQGIVTVEAEDSQLTAEAVLEDGSTLTAQIEIPKIDTAAPEITASKDGSQVTLTAEDARSGVRVIRYAAVEETAYLAWPQYQDYTESFATEDGYLYYFYAEDDAGNRSTVTVTTFAAAEALSFAANDTDGLVLFPDETVSLAAAVQPAGALLTNLKYESSDDSVAVVDDTGLVTAAAEGSAEIRVSADGVDPVSCTVDVAESRTVTISAVGDCTIGTDAYFNTSTNFDAYYSVNGASWFFRNVRDILAEDDATFANLEGTLTTETTRENKEYAFKGDPSYTEILQDGSIDVVTLANNHSSDYGAKSLTDTEQYLTDAGIAYCLGETVAYQKINGISTAFIGIYELADGLSCETQLRAAIAEAQEQGAKLIITAFHWGSESSTTPDETQISLAHTAIDCGADLVVGHHPHVLQGIEKYNGKYIVYSLGNFCFGGNSSPSDTDTMIFRQTFTVSADGAKEDDAIEIIPCSITSASGYNNYQPTPATGEEADRILSRINEYSAAFGTTVYTAAVSEDAV